MVSLKIFIVKERNHKKHCNECGSGFDDGDIVIEYVSSGIRIFNFRWSHLRCVLKNAEGLISKKTYAELYDEWLINQV